MDEESRATVLKLASEIGDLLDSVPGDALSKLDNREAARLPEKPHR